MYSDLSKKQVLILNYIRAEVAKKGYPPSVREICLAVGLKSTSTVHGHLKKIEEKGYIRRDSTKPRAIEILEDTLSDTSLINTNTAYIPLVGNVTAGVPILAVENIEEQFPVPSDMVNSGTFFMLRVQGDSMIEAGIFDRDYVIVKKQNQAKNGDTVVALIDDSATVKTFYKESDHIRLQPENSALSPIISKDVSVLGIVKGVFRRM
ncbi:transcriptional repressor LexA [Helicovermis profundi]|uniref:LexA repressor n=1 Tax=Helicovermis profundi TaxID=3065157 RepID=A0AAU9EEB2_9FIRM|nr:transcriptional repressor LexA [Clostridia bacterium S502]